MFHCVNCCLNNWLCKHVVGDGMNVFPSSYVLELMRSSWETSEFPFAGVWVVFVNLFIEQLFQQVRITGLQLKCKAQLRFDESYAY